MATMPDVVGETLADATATLEASGVIVLNSLGYFDTWPITVNWTQSTSPFETVLDQSPAATTTVSANSAVTLTVAAGTVGVVYP